MVNKDENKPQTGRWSSIFQDQYNQKNKVFSRKMGKVIEEQNIKPV